MYSQCLPEYFLRPLDKRRRSSVGSRDQPKPVVATDQTVSPTRFVSAARKLLSLSRQSQTGDKMAPVVAVVGGGVVGLTTAVKLQQQIPAASVRIISDQWSPDITR